MTEVTTDTTDTNDRNDQPVAVGGISKDNIAGVARKMDSFVSILW